MFASASVRKGLLRPAIMVVAVGGFLSMGVLSAQATIKGPQDLTVSCDATTPKTGVSVTQRHTGDFKIKQNSSNPSSRSVVWAVSSLGNSLPAREIGTGGTATWTAVQPSQYRVHVHRAGSKDCNGFFIPGKGNYDWNYTVTYSG